MYSFLFCVALLFAPANEPRLVLSLYTLHQSQERLCFFRGKTLAACDVLWKGMDETPNKVVESSNKCFICSSIPTSKNKIYIFGKTSTDLAGPIRSSLEFDVKKYHEDSNLFVCRQCFQHLTKYERAAKKLREMKEELLSAFRNREQLREKKTCTP